MRKSLRAGVAIGAFLLALASIQQVFADSHGDGIRHVLLISVDGMHALDYANCANGISTKNGGAPYCPNLKALGEHGVNYLNSSTSKPSDSFPGLMALVTGGSPRTVGAFYDVAYDRTLSPPAKTTGNGLTGGPGLCPSQIGTRTEYEEGIDIDQTQLDAGGGIDPERLVRDPSDSCNPVYPWNFVRVNTIFGVAHHAGLYTAWSDKHLAYRAVSGPEKGDTVGKNVDDFYSPEINSDSYFAPSAADQLSVAAARCPITPRSRPAMTTPGASRISSVTTASRSRRSSTKSTANATTAPGTCPCRTSSA